MGLSTVTGICTPDYGCVIGEMGVRDKNQKPYPSTGFTSVYVMAHEIGHNLGMHHDSSGNSCPSNGYIMSPSRGTKGETVWSSCSRDFMRSLDMKCLEDKPAQQSGDNKHDVYGNRPGLSVEWDADKQCQMLMLKPEARLDHTMNPADICYSLKCRVEGTPGYYRAGPALEGTPCGKEKICHQGECVECKDCGGKGNSASWSSWSEWSQCQSGCITRSRGYKKKTRECIKENPGVDSICPGTFSEISLCDDAACSRNMPGQHYASQQCKEFLKADGSLDSKITKHGYQPSHIRDRVMTACTVHCKKPSGGWYAPVLELGDKMDVYFPDGTFCHSEGGTDYYCREHQCVSSARGARSDKIPDLPVNNNAKPDGELHITADAEAYFSLDNNGQPKSNNYHNIGDMENDDNQWMVDK